MSVHPQAICPWRIHMVQHCETSSSNVTQKVSGMNLSDLSELHASGDSQPGDNATPQRGM
jgi:hypothetical protein